MGFIFDFDTCTVTEHVYMLDHGLKPFTRFNITTFDNFNYKLNTLDNVMFFDMEVDGLLRSQINTTNTYIPNIREWSYLYAPTLQSIDITQTVTYYTKNYTDTIKTFWEVYNKLNHPILLAHNGNNFDFLILIAHTYRYLENAEKLIQNLKCYDTYTYIKNKSPFGSKSNSALFIKYLCKYPNYENLQYKAHNSKEDTQMLALWFPNAFSAS
ncbi:hypothetical protein MrNuV_ORF089 [Macrobrachium rosenbergii nudivirus]|nr:hypothetical protein MrNuV_ORF089 [Macrobrachium rosenbergii nudivirus]